MPTYKENYIRVSIFLSIFDVHINRSPCHGTIKSISYQSGRFLNALDRRASTQNEQNVIEISLPSGRIYVVQIAGLLARRIKCFTESGKQVTQGERIGLIKFSSRTDIYLPASFSLLVREGQSTIGGETVIGCIPLMKDRSGQSAAMNGH
jgi:phosphatidylserine decarboxylase